MLIAATLLLCYFPFAIVIAALAGHSTAVGLTRRLGLNHQAAADMGHAFASAHTTSRAVTGASLALCVLGGIAIASTVQELYERAFGLPSRGMKDFGRRCAWLGILVGGTFLTGWALPGLRHLDAIPLT